jgi:hypothetical protein
MDDAIALLAIAQDPRHPGFAEASEVILKAVFSHDIQFFTILLAIAERADADPRLLFQVFALIRRS